MGEQSGGVSNPWAGWYPDPYNPDQLRWWDGQRWHAHVQTQPAATPDKAAQLPRSTSVEASVSAEFASPAKPAEVSPGSASNQPTLAELHRRLRPYPGHVPIDEQIEVAGETFHVKGIKKLYRGLGLTISERGTTIEDVVCVLLPEPWNPADPNAVAVFVEGQHVGYVPADESPYYSPHLRRLAGQGHCICGEARVWAKADGSVIRARVTIVVPEVDELADL